MLYFSRWKAIAILVTALLVCLFAVPNFFPRDRCVTELAEVGAAPHRARPRPAGRLPHPARGRRRAMSPGRRWRSLRDDVRRVLREARVGYTGAGDRAAARVEVRMPNAADRERALTKLRELSQPLGGLLSAPPASAPSTSPTSGDGLIQLTLTRAGDQRAHPRKAVEQSIQIVERRVNELGTVEPTIQRQGVDRILVQVPGLQDPHAAQGTPRQDRQARPSGWSTRRCRPNRRAGPAAAGFRSALRDAEGGAALPTWSRSACHGRPARTSPTRSPASISAPASRSSTSASTPTARAGSPR